MSLNDITNTIQILTAEIGRNPSWDLSSQECTDYYTDDRLWYMTCRPPKNSPSDSSPMIQRVRIDSAELSLYHCSLHRGEMSMGELFRGRAVWSQKKIAGNLLNAHEPSARDWFQWTSDENREMSTERTAARVKSFPFCGWVGHNFRIKLHRNIFY